MEFILRGTGRAGRPIRGIRFCQKKTSVPFCPDRCGRIFSGQKRHSAFLPQNSPERGGLVLCVYCTILTI